MTADKKDSEPNAVQNIHDILVPFSPSSRARIIGAIFSLLDIAKIEIPENYQILLSGLQNAGADMDLSKITNQAFLKNRKPVSISQRLACLAYFLERHDQLAEITAKNLKKANDEARLEPIGDIARDLSSAARREHFFKNTKEHTYQLTSLGIDVVEALPDKDRVKAVIEEHSTRTTKPKLKTKK